MAELGFRNFGRWAAGALCATTLLAAHAQPPHNMGRAWNHPFGGMNAFGGHPVSAREAADSHNSHAYGMRQRMAGPDQGLRGLRGQRLAGGDRENAASFGTRLRTVSDTRPFQRQDSSPPYMRAGSIRADVARYNEERESTRLAPRRSDDEPRPPPPSPYRGN